MKGKVKFFNEVKEFGFITGEDGKDYFVHKSAVKDDLKLSENDAVVFDVEKGDRGPKASNVQKEWFYFNFVIISLFSNNKTEEFIKLLNSVFYMDNVLYSNAKGMAQLVGGNGKMLEQLASGQNESYWDFIVSLVESGKIDSNVAVTSLASGLAKLHAQYQEWSRKPHIPEGYWSQRVKDVENTLNQIFDKDQSTVSYRGFSVEKNQEFDMPLN